MIYVEDELIKLNGVVLPGLIKKIHRVSGFLVGYGDADLGGSGKGIALNMVNGQGKIAKLISPLGRFIGRIAFSVDRF